MDIWTVEFVIDAMKSKEFRKGYVLFSIVCLQGFNLVASEVFYVSFEMDKGLQGLRFVLQKIYPSVLGVCICKVYVVPAAISGRNGRRSTNV